YSLHGVFASSREPGELPLLAQPDPTAPAGAFEKELQKRQAKYQELAEHLRTEAAAEFRSRFGDNLLASRDTGNERNAQSLARWRTYLGQQAQTHHPVLAPWFAFAQLSPAEFADKAPALAARITANRDKELPINPLVAKAFAGKPPASLGEVARRYDGVVREVEQAWQEAQKKGKKGRLDDASQEAVRQVLYGPGSPSGVSFDELPRLVNRAQRNRLREARRQVDQWLATSTGGPPRAMVLVDMPSPVTPRVLVRGN